jgi:hypothetical protein
MPAVCCAQRALSLADFQVVCQQGVVIMNIGDALYNAVHDYPGGAGSMAPRMGISESSLTKKVNPNYPMAHPSPEEMARICELSNDKGPLIAFAARLGCVVLPAPHVSAGEDCTAAHQLAGTVKEFGDFVVEASKDLADNQCTRVELRKIQREGLEAIAAIHRLCALADEMHEAGKPGAQRRVRS